MFYPVLRSKWFIKTRKRLKKIGRGKFATTFLTSIALLIVWFFTGLWHGASWNYVLYGVYYGVIMVISNLMEPTCVKWRTKHEKIVRSVVWGGIA